MLDPVELVLLGIGKSDLHRRVVDDDAAQSELGRVHELDPRPVVPVLSKIGEADRRRDVSPGAGTEQPPVDLLISLSDVSQSFGVSRIERENTIGGGEALFVSAGIEVTLSFRQERLNGVLSGALPFGFLLNLGGVGFGCPWPLGSWGPRRKWIGAGRGPM